MRRIALAVVLASSLMVASLAAEGQQAGRVSRIAYLGTRTPSDFGLISFRQALRELGWVEGQNLAIEYRFAEGRLDRLPELAAELARLKVDVFVAHSTPGAKAAKRATETIPIVMISVGDPVGLELIANLARPGGNLTGLSYSAFGLEIIGKTIGAIQGSHPQDSPCGGPLERDQPDSAARDQRGERRSAVVGPAASSLGGTRPQRVPQ